MESVAVQGNGKAGAFTHIMMPAGASMTLDSKPDIQAPPKMSDGATLADRLEWFFPDFGISEKPVSYRVMIQMERRANWEGGLFLAAETIHANRIWSSRGRVVAVGNTVFHDMTTGIKWPSAPWYRVGDYVRCPVQGGFRIFPERMPREFRETIEFRYYNERDILSVLVPEDEFSV